jgi:peptide/nickel transport system substrate-binding protein
VALTDRADLERALDTTFSRSELIRRAALGGVALTSAGLLAACGGDDDDAAAPSGATAAGTEAEGTPKRGGRLRVGLTGSGNADSLDPGLADNNAIGIFRTYLLYDTLVRITPDSQLAPGIAEEWEPNADSSSWTFRLREGVVFHDGKPLTADDVLYSLRWATEPPNNVAASLTAVDVNRLRKVDDRTIEVNLTQSQILFPYILADAAAAMIPDGTTEFGTTNGTGAFKLKSFSQGRETVLERNPDYWDNGKPYVDELVFASIDDDSARLNALLSGEIEVMSNLPYVQGRELEGSDQVQLFNAPSNTAYLLYMRVDQPPFDDNRVRQAMKLIVDREAMIANALNGFGTVANDLVGKGLPFYAEEIPQTVPDIEQARSLLDEAGQSGLSVTLSTAPVSPGLPEAGTLFADQAREAGVNVTIENVPANAFWDTSLQYLKIPFASSLWVLSSLPQWYTQAVAVGAPYNESHWDDPAFEQLLQEAIGAPDEEVSRERWLEVQQIQHDEGGYVIWGNADNLDALAPNVMGMTPGQAYGLGAPTGLIDAWLA